MAMKKWFPDGAFQRCPNCSHMLGEVRSVGGSEETVLKKNVCPGCDRKLKDLADVDWSLAGK